MIGNYYNQTITINNVPSDAKYFLAVATRIDSGGNTNRLWGDISNQQIKQCESSSGNAAIAFSDATWNDYVSSVGSGSITLTGRLTYEIGGSKQSIDVYFWS